jgi:mannose-6-phosphate isomerase-like protein (cupin superfamily)
VISHASPGEPGQDAAVWNRDRLHDRREGLFGGSGVVLVWNLCDEGPTPPFGAVLACELEGGGSVGDHLQQELAEVVIVIEGEGVARAGGSPVALRPGVVVEVPLGRTLAIENASSDLPLRYLIVKAR